MLLISEQKSPNIKLLPVSDTKTPELPRPWKSLAHGSDVPRVSDNIGAETRHVSGAAESLRSSSESWSPHKYTGH